MWTEGPRRLALSLGHVELAADALLSAFLVLESSCWGSDPMAPLAVAPGAAQRPDVQTSRPGAAFVFSLLRQALALSHAHADLFSRRHRG